ncbi:RDD family protein [Sinosporangium siamense]|uniref:RDD family protein n=1 Tax=Sinosporangium siamense TaxID=1367973 RepID=A0A919RJK8_9ACTN|nr:RDD family protein [Sinosporangium siamense]
MPAPLGGRWRRLFAGIVDSIIISLISTPVTWQTWSHVLDEERGAWARINLSQTFFLAVVAFLYYWLLQAYWHGQTIGKKIFGLRVISETGERLAVGQAAIRQAVMAVLAWLCCLWIIDLGWILIDPRKQAIHDKAARTLVVDS